MSPWVMRDQPAEVLTGEDCITCGRNVYLAKKRAADGVLCTGCGLPHVKCFCPDVREMVSA